MAFSPSPATPIRDCRYAVGECYSYSVVFDYQSLDYHLAAWEMDHHEVFTDWHGFEDNIPHVVYLEPHYITLMA